MNRDRMARTAAWSLSTAIVLCLVSPAVAQRDLDPAAAQLLPTPAGEIPSPSLPLPLPIAQGARWLRYSLLAPLQPQPAQQPAPKQDEVSPQVRELEGVMQNRIGSVLRGTIFDGNPARDQAEQRRILAELERQHLAEERSNTKRVSDDGETETLPGIMQWPVPTDDPLQAAAEHLRVSARNLDLVAADLEDAGKYKEADKLRSRAQQLRNDARGFASQQETTDRR